MMIFGFSIKNYTIIGLKSFSKCRKTIKKKKKIFSLKFDLFIKGNLPIFYYKIMIFSTNFFEFQFFLIFLKFRGPMDTTIVKNEKKYKIFEKKKNFFLKKIFQPSKFFDPSDLLTFSDHFWGRKKKKKIFFFLRFFDFY